MGNGEEGLICTALRDSLRQGYSWNIFKHDFLAGLIVSFVAIPLAMAFSIAVGLPPQHGLLTAIIAGFVVPLLGGSHVQVSGPTAAFIVILAPLVAKYGVSGLIPITVLSGCLLILFGVSRAGYLIELFPKTVVIGFTTGIAVVIGTVSLNDLLGLKIYPLPNSYLNKIFCIVQHLPKLSLAECIVSTTSLLTMWSMKYFIPKFPAPLIGIIVGGVIASMLHVLGFQVSTIGNHFSYVLPNGVVGSGIPPLWPTLEHAVVTLSWPPVGEWGSFFMPACTVALLSALESLLSAAIADSMIHKKHNANAELIGIGIGNILSGLASGIPATGAIARTAKNIRNGAKTPIAASLHALFILCYVLWFRDILSFVPMAALAALMIRVAFHMSHYRNFFHIVKTGSIQEITVLMVCFLLTVFIDMVAGISAGLLLFFVFKFFTK